MHARSLTLGYPEPFRMNKSDVTLKTLADELGLSTSTVSRALKNNRSIHSDTRALVMATAARMGYDKPVRSNAGIVDRNIRLLLLLPPYGRPQVNLVFPVVLRGVTAAANQLGCDLRIDETPEASYGKMRRKGTLPPAIRRKEVDVLILTGRHNAEDVAVLMKVLPTVSIQWDYPGTGLDMANAFNSRGIAAQVDYLVAKGHRRLAYVDSDYPSSFFLERQAGYLQACLAHGLSLDPAKFLKAAEVDTGVIARLRAEGVTALVTSNDEVAVRMAQVCDRMGLRVPEDLSLTGFDASPQSLASGKVLTGYDPGFAEIGRAAVQLAIQRAKQPEASRTIVSREGTFVEGETVAAVGG